MVQLEKRVKETWENLGITGNILSNEDTIWPKGKIQDKWEQIKITDSWYFYMKTLVEDRFDNIGVDIIKVEKILI